MALAGALLGSTAMGWGSARADMFRDGVYQLNLISWWPLGMVLHHLQDETAPPDTGTARARLERSVEDVESWYRHLPLSHFHLWRVWRTGTSKGWIIQRMGPTGGRRDLATKVSEVDVPILHWNGWFDYQLDATLKSFLGIRAHGLSERCRKSQRLVIGPWGHLSVPVGELDFGPDAVLDEYALSSAMVRLLVEGRGEWGDG